MVPPDLDPVPGDRQDGRPQTVDEWQEAALIAAGLRLIHDARLHRFIEGGPEIDVDRVDSVLTDAASVGIVPTLAEAQRVALDMVAEMIAEANDA